jgi:hypothetical protein
MALSARGRQPTASPVSRAAAVGRGRQLLLVLSAIMPWRIRVFAYRRLLHWEIDATARVAISFIGYFPSLLGLFGMDQNRGVHDSGRRPNDHLESLD